MRAPIEHSQQGDIVDSTVVVVVIVELLSVMGKTIVKTTTANKKKAAKSLAANMFISQEKNIQFFYCLVNKTN